MKRWIAVFLVLLMLGGTCLLPVQAQRLSADTPTKTPAMIGHKGYSEKYPENTALAIEKAAEAGFSGTEADVRLTKDGVFVLSHDETIETADGQTLRLSRCTYEELTAQPLKNEFDTAPVYLCRLEDYLDLCKENDLICFIEIKEYWMIHKIVELFAMVRERYEFQKCEIQSFELLPLLVARLFFPQARIMLATNEYNFNAKAAFLLGFDLDMRFDGLTAQIVEKFHSRNRRVSCFTVNDATEAKRCAALGVDFMETDVFPVFPADA